MALALSTTDLVADGPAPIAVALDMQDPGVRERVRQAVALSGAPLDERGSGLYDTRPGLHTRPARHETGAGMHATGPRLREPGPDCPADVVLVQGGRHRNEIVRCFEAARTRWGSTPTIGVWPDGEPLEERLALRAGVSGLILESEIEHCLLAAAQAACSGQVCLPRQVSPWERASMLSAREKEVLAMLIVGSTNAQIGRKLYLAESTVKSHVSSAYVKLGVRSRKDAAALLVECEDALGLDHAAA